MLPLDDDHHLVEVPVIAGPRAGTAQIGGDDGSKLQEPAADGFVGDVQAPLGEHPEKMRQRRETVEHPFGTIKSWMGATHFQMRTLKRVGTERALRVLAYNLKRVMAIMGIVPLIAAMSAA